MKPQSLLTALILAISCLPNPAMSQETVLRFKGQLVQPQPDGQEIILREFRCVLIDRAARPFFFVEESIDGCPWPATFGSSTNSAGGGVTPHLQFEYIGVPYTIPLPDLKMAFPKNLNESSRWKSGNWSWAITSDFGTDSKTIRLQGTERRGRRQTSEFDRQTGWLISSKLDVFMGRGDQFFLTLERTSVDALPSQHSAQQLNAENALLKLQLQLGLRSDSQRHDLSAGQIQSAAAALEQLPDIPKDLPCQPLIHRISQQVIAQQESLAVAQTAMNATVGQLIADFELNLLSKQRLTQKQLKGQLLVLHFWNYSEDAMEEPYGQTGYLEFLANKIQDDSVNVVGIITNQQMQSDERRNQEIRSARKVAEFMNLTYPIGYDDGSLVKKYLSSAKPNDNSPLWIVVDATGKIVHYHRGYYEVDGQAGLKALSSAIKEAKR